MRTARPLGAPRRPRRAARVAARGRNVVSRVLLVGLVSGLLVAAGPAPVAGEVVADGYAVETLADGSPAAWKPCRRVTWALARQGLPAGAGDDVREAMRLTGLATGLDFVEAGRVEKVPQRGWLRPGGWPAGAPDLVVAWAVPAAGGSGRAPTSDLLTSGGRAAVGGWTAEHREGGGAAHIVHGFVVLNVEADDRFVAGTSPSEGWLSPGRPPRVRLLLHELGHVVGLAHVDDDRQVMYPHVLRQEAAWADGDRAGLLVLRGGATCDATGGRRLTG